MYHDPRIYCIMITGKNEDRYKFVNIAMSNFEQQTYRNKHLLIINHGNRRSLASSERSDVTEIMFSKNDHMTLGDMRNFSLDLVPLHALWTIWDDDDWRHPRYLELMHKNMVDHDADAVFIKNRLDYNLGNHFVYRARFERGMPFVLAKKIDAIRYLSKESLEDIRLLNDFELYDKKVYMINNDPRWYIRTIHGQNTSIYVDAQKSSIVNYSHESAYREFDVTDKEKRYSQDIVGRYFRNI
jgi:hypothetical protein